MELPDLGAWLRSDGNPDASLTLPRPVVAALHEESQRLNQSNARMRKQNAKLRRRIARLKGDAGAASDGLDDLNDLDNDNLDELGAEDQVELPE